MRLGFIVDAGSPISRSWLGWLCQAGHEVHVLSTYPADEGGLGLASLRVEPVAFSGLSRPSAAQAGAPAPVGLRRKLLTRSVGVLRHRVGLSRLSFLRDALGPLDAWRRRRVVSGWVQQHRPQLVHAMRIPFEGVLAAEGLRATRLPLVLSIWGNDLTLHAPASRVLTRFSRRALARADALHTDCRRDLATSLSYGWQPSRPHLLAPGNGGLDLTMFRPGPPDLAAISALGLPTSPGPWLVNARGLRGYVRNEVFFAALPSLFEKFPDARVAALGMRGNPSAEAWREASGSKERIFLLPTLPRAAVAELFRLAAVAVSPSEHDGTPNSLLEAMACGAFPVAGDIPSVREWIAHGENGLLCDPRDVRALASQLLEALSRPGLRASAAAANSARIATEAGISMVMPRVVEFYSALIARPGVT